MSEARCAAHSELRAIGACGRCGDYYCTACEHPRHPRVCVRCGARLPSGLAWEDPRAGGLAARFAKSVCDLFLRPRVAFPGPARFGRAQGFAALVGLALGVWSIALGAPLLAAGRLAARDLAPRDALLGGLLLLVGAPALLLVFGWLSAVSFTAGLHAVGRRVGAFRVALRTCAYAQLYLVACLLLPTGARAAALWSEPAPALIELTHALWVGTGVAWPLLTGRLCYAAGRGLGLDGGRAAAASIGPVALCAMIAAYQMHQVLEFLL